MAWEPEGKPDGGFDTASAVAGFGSCAAGCLCGWYGNMALAITAGGGECGG